MSNNRQLVYANAHDAYDDAAWYIDGRLVGREGQTNIIFDVLPKLSGMTVYFSVVEIPANPDDPYGNLFFWPEQLTDLGGNDERSQATAPGRQWVRNHG